jgi:hypothetical protein
MKTEFEAAKLNCRSNMFSILVTPAMTDELETERALYAVRPSRNEVVNQLLQDGLIFRRMHRPSGKRKKPKRIPFPITFD